MRQSVFARFVEPTYNRRKEKEPRDVALVQNEEDLKSQRRQRLCPRDDSLLRNITGYVVLLPNRRHFNLNLYLF